MREPESMDELLFFTNRRVDDGSIKAWVYRPGCPKCDGLLGKPKKRAETYDCAKCGFQASKEDVEKDLKVEVVFKCPYCGHDGETTTEYKRKTWKGVPSFVFVCDGCNKKIGITKKLKSPK